MRIKVLGAVLPFVFSLALGGCLVHTHDGNRGSSRHASKSRSKQKSRSCKPSQYWDGRTCRHKGKGHGARKHDGR